MSEPNFTILFAEIFFGIFLILSVRVIWGRKLGTRVTRLLWVLLVIRALVPFSLPVSHHPLGWLGISHREMSPVHEEENFPERERGFLVQNEGNPIAVESFSDSRFSHGTGDETSGFLPDHREKQGGFLVETLVFFWGAGAVALVFIAVFRNRNLVKNATKYPAPVPDWVQEIFLELREKTGLGTWPVLIVSPCVPTPCLVGAIRPRILIPESLLAEPEDRESLRFVLLHEMLHLKYGDIWLSWCWTLVLALHWFNPLFWLLGSWMKRDCETACDERVLEILGSQARKNYADSLLRVLQTLHPGPVKIVGLSAVIETASHLQRRMEMMNSYKKPTVRKTLTGLLVLCFLAGISLTGFAENPERISPEKAQMIGYIEHYLMLNGPADVMKKSLQWGEPGTDPKGNLTLQYKYETSVRGKNPTTENKIWTFSKTGKFVSVKNVEGFPKADPGTPVDTKASQKLAGEGWGLFIRGNFGDAEEKFQQAIEKNPKNANAYQGLGWAQTNSGNTEEAKKTFARCLELDPKNTAAMNGLGVIAREEGDEDTMLKVWTKAVEIDKTATGPMSGLAHHYERQGDKKNALKYYQLWNKVEPSSEEAKSGMQRNR